MGFKVPELTASSKSPLAEGKWEVEFTKFVTGENAAKDKEYVQPVWKITEEEPVDMDGEAFKGRLYGDRYWQTGNAMWRFKKFAEEAGVELPDANTEFDTVGEYAEELTSLFHGTTAVANVIVRDYEKDGETRYTNDVESYEF